MAHTSHKPADTSPELAHEISWPCSAYPLWAEQSPTANYSISSLALLSRSFGLAALGIPSLHHTFQLSPLARAPTSFEAFSSRAFCHRRNSTIGSPTIAPGRFNPRRHPGVVRRRLIRITSFNFWCHSHVARQRALLRELVLALIRLGRFRFRRPTLGIRQFRRLLELFSLHDNNFIVNALSPIYTPPSL